MSLVSLKFCSFSLFLGFLDSCKVSWILVYFCTSVYLEKLGIGLPVYLHFVWFLYKFYLCFWAEVSLYIDILHIFSWLLPFSLALLVEGFWCVLLLIGGFWSFHGVRVIWCVRVISYCESYLFVCFESRPWFLAFHIHVTAMVLLWDRSRVLFAGTVAEFIYTL